MPTAARNEGGPQGHHAGLGSRSNLSYNNGVDQYDYNLAKNTKMVLDFTADDQPAAGKYEEQKQLQNNKAKYGA